MKNDPISSIMSRNVVTIELRDTLENAERLMRTNRIRHLPVVHKGKLVGIISLTDLMRLSFSDNFGEVESNVDVAIFEMLRIEHVMMSKPVTISPAQTARDAAEILAQREFHALPVVEGPRVVGIVTTTDLIRYFLSIMREDES